MNRLQFNQLLTKCEPNNDDMHNWCKAHPYKWPSGLWELCDRGDWMAIWLYRMDKCPPVTVIYDCANRAIKYSILALKNCDSLYGCSIDDLESCIVTNQNTAEAARDCVAKLLKVITTYIFSSEKFIACQVLDQTKEIIQDAVEADCRYTFFSIEHVAGAREVLDQGYGIELKWYADRLREWLPNPFEQELSNE